MLTLFKTAHGSLYFRGNDGRTCRFKVSAGNNRDELHDLQACVFIPPDIQTEHFDLGRTWIGEDERVVAGSVNEQGIFRPWTENIPRICAGEVPYIIKRDRRSKKVIAQSLVSLEPRIGWTPFEQGYETDGRIFHMGHPVIEIFSETKKIRQALWEQANTLLEKTNAGRPERPLIEYAVGQPAWLEIQRKLPHAFSRHELLKIKTDNGQTYHLGGSHEFPYVAKAYLQHQQGGFTLTGEVLDKTTSPLGERRAIYPVQEFLFESGPPIKASALPADAQLSLISAPRPRWWEERTSPLFNRSCTPL